MAVLAADPSAGEDQEADQERAPPAPLAPSSHDGASESEPPSGNTSSEYQPVLSGDGGIKGSAAAPVPSTRRRRYGVAIGLVAALVVGVALVAWTFMYQPRAVTPKLVACNE